MVTLNKSPLEALYTGRSPREAGRLFERLVRKIFLRVPPHMKSFCFLPLSRGS
jgi:hypothetical protein